MIQDLDFGYLDNQYKVCLPQDEDVMVCVSGKDVLVARDADRYLSLPTWGEIKDWC